MDTAIKLDIKSDNLIQCIFLWGSGIMFYFAFTFKFKGPNANVEFYLSSHYPGQELKILTQSLLAIVLRRPKVWYASFARRLQSCCLIKRGKSQLRAIKADDLLECANLKIAHVAIFSRCCYCRRRHHRRRSVIRQAAHWLRAYCSKVKMLSFNVLQ